VKLLLDVHHSRRAAERLRDAGHDVVAASDHAELATLTDEELLRHAAADHRTVVTENTKDFDRIVRMWSVTGEHHAGIVFTSPRRFHRGRVGYPEDLVAALDRLLAAPPEAHEDWVHWLA
jgi:Domain of unknown function (DUF5615)